MHEPWRELQPETFEPDAEYVVGDSLFESRARDGELVLYAPTEILRRRETDLGLLKNHEVRAWRLPRALILSARHDHLLYAVTSTTFEHLHTFERSALGSNLRLWTNDSLLLVQDRLDLWASPADAPHQRLWWRDDWSPTWHLDHAHGQDAWFHDDHGRVRLDPTSGAAHHHRPHDAPPNDPDERRVEINVLPSP